MKWKFPFICSVFACVVYDVHVWTRSKQFIYFDNGKKTESRKKMKCWQQENDKLNFGLLVG